MTEYYPGKDKRMDSTDKLYAIGWSVVAFGVVLIVLIIALAKEHDSLSQVIDSCAKLERVEEQRMCVDAALEVFKDSPSSWY